MRIKANVYSRGFRVTTDDPSKTYKKDLFKPFDPAIGKEFIEKRSAIQNILADKAISIPDNVTNSKSPVTILSGGSITTVPKALEALRELKNHGLIRADRTIELNKWRSTPQYKEVMDEAMAAGATHFRAPCAKVAVTIYVREEEQQLVFDTFPEDILADIDICRETPLEVAPIYEVAKHCRAMLNDLIKKVGEAKSKAFDDWENDAVCYLRDAGVMLDGLDLHTKEAKTFRENLKDALSAAATRVEEIRTAETYYVYARKEILKLGELADVVTASGLDIYEERLVGKAEKYATNRKKLNKEIDEEAMDLGLDL